jgi:hypothetical protein
MPIVACFTVMSIYVGSLCFLAWFKYPIYVKYLLKREAIKKKLGLPVLRLWSQPDYEDDFTKWYSRIGLLLVTIVFLFLPVLWVLTLIDVLK